MQGSCLCGNVAFELSGPLPLLYQCHCSLCRKQSGAAASAATIVPASDFRWLRGQDGIGSWIRASGFRSDFCRACGTTLPNPVRDLPYMWVPAGLLDSDSGLAIGVQVFLDSKAAWDIVPGPGHAFPGCPPLLDFIRLLRAGAN